MISAAKARYAGLLAGVLCISFSAVFVKLAQVDSTVSAFYRCFYSSIFLFIIALVKGELKGASWNWLVPAFWGGFFLAVDLIIWHKSIIYIGAGPATILANSQVCVYDHIRVFCFQGKDIPLVPAYDSPYFSGTLPYHPGHPDNGLTEDRLHSWYSCGYRLYRIPAGIKIRQNQIP